MPHSYSLFKLKRHYDKPANLLSPNELIQTYKEITMKEQVENKTTMKHEKKNKIIFANSPEHCRTR